MSALEKTKLTELAYHFFLLASNINNRIKGPESQTSSPFWMFCVAAQGQRRGRVR